MTDFTQSDKYTQAIGKTIKSIELIDADILDITFVDGTSIAFRDKMQLCCEYRYMHTDDDLGSFAGAKFLSAELRDIDDSEYTDEDEPLINEVMFLLVNTSIGTFTVESHNQHNGYYSGFNLVIE